MAKKKKTPNKEKGGQKYLRSSSGGYSTSEAGRRLRQQVSTANKDNAPRHKKKK